MDIQLIVCQAGRRVSFELIFLNNEAQVAFVPVDSIKRSGERIGLEFRSGNAILRPIEFGLINPRTAADGVELPPKKNHSIVLAGTIEEKAPNVFALIFSEAVYKIDLAEPYSVQFKWGDWKSNAIEWTPH
jgi:hypothetical protein